MQANTSMIESTERSFTTTPAEEVFHAELGGITLGSPYWPYQFPDIRG
jgi:hypothetical protein